MRGRKNNSAMRQYIWDSVKLEAIYMMFMLERNTMFGCIWRIFGYDIPCCVGLDFERDNMENLGFFL